MPDRIKRYITTEHKGNVTEIVNPYDVYTEVTSYKSLASSFRIGVKYTYPKYRIAPTAEAGAAYTRLGGELAKIEILRPNCFGYYLAVGTDYRIKTNHAVFIRLVYENYPILDAVQRSGRDKISMPHLKIGYIF
jgi:hypothetical protein